MGWTERSYEPFALGVGVPSPETEKASDAFSGAKDENGTYTPREAEFKSSHYPRNFPWGSESAENEKGSHKVITPFSNWMLKYRGKAAQLSGSEASIWR
jgi:hypothetical protein